MLTDSDGDYYQEYEHFQLVIVRNNWKLKWKEGLQFALNNSLILFLIKINWNKNILKIVLMGEKNPANVVSI